MIQYTGISGFACRHPEFPWKRFLKQYPKEMKHPALAVLWLTFGESDHCIEEFCKRYPEGLVEVHISNGPGRRNGKLQQGDFLWKYDVDGLNLNLEEGNEKIGKAIQETVDEINSLSLRHPENIFIICPELEDNLSYKAFRRFVQYIRAAWPEVQIVRNACKPSGARVGLVEVHDDQYLINTPKHIWNNDGRSIDVGDPKDKYFEKDTYTEIHHLWHRFSRIFCRYLWYAPQQGLQDCSGWTANVPVPKDRKFCVSDKAIEFSLEMLKEFGE